MTDLKEKTIRGALTRLFAQGSNLLIRVGSLLVLARLLTPRDFGLIGMVTAFTGVLNLFRDFGLSAATVQRATVTAEQTSTLFWINILFGAILASVSVLLAPVLAAFYHEPRLFWVTIIVASGFLFNAAGIQHAARLQRQMRFTALAVVDLASLVVASGIAIGAARAGFGYWALVAMTVTLPLTASLGFWVATGWIPGAPQRRAGVRSMMRFGGAITLNGLVVYAGSNAEKVLLGRFWGAEAIGIYGRAYQLIRIPTDNLNSAVGEVAFSALSRLQNDAIRLRNYFLKGYSLLVALTLPLTIACALFADDIILVLLGPKWMEAAVLFRLLAPTILVFAIANPLAWLLTSLGLVGRLVKMGLVIAPIMIAGYVIAMPYGPRGVALAYSAVMILWLIPLVIWALHGTAITPRDLLRALNRPLTSALVAAAIAFPLRLLYGHMVSPVLRLLLENGLLCVIFLGLLLFVKRQRSLYLDVCLGLLRRSPQEAGRLASAQ